jgi:hypothetical protein
LANLKIVPFVVALALLSVSLVAPIAAAQTPNTGTQFVVYRVVANGPNHTISATVNETVAQTTRSGFASVTLQVISATANFSYSKLVNTSEKLLPILPSLGTRSIQMTKNNTMLAASVNETGTQSIGFSGANYTVTNYSFAISVQSAHKSGSASGQLSLFASGLVYSASVNINGTRTVSVQLLSTNVSLGTSSSGSSSTTTIAVTSGSVGAIGVGAFVFYRKERKESSSSSSEAKPLHWVD